MFTPLGIVELARLGILPEVGVDEIDDRSKADNIAKIFVCAQLLCFVVQLIARAISGLPVTLLELHVLVHIICAILLYIIWFNKPYDVRSPYICRDQRVVDLAMFFILKDSEVRWGRVQTAQKHTIEMKHVVRTGKVDEKNPRCVDHLRAVKRAIKFLENHGSTLSWGVHDATNAICFQHQYVTSWSSDYEMVGSICDNVEFQRGEKTHLFNSRIICALGVLYGAGHLVAWNFAFPSAVEKWMWRISGVSCVVFPVAEQLAESKYFTRPLDDKISALTRFSAGLLYGLVFLGGPMLVWPSARFFLIAETFASLRSPAPGTYQTVQYTQAMSYVS
jgi:hypothetical protein